MEWMPEAIAVPCAWWVVEWDRQPSAPMRDGRADVDVRAIATGSFAGADLERCLPTGTKQSPPTLSAERRSQVSRSLRCSPWSGKAQGCGVTERALLSFIRGASTQRPR